MNKTRPSLSAFIFNTIEVVLLPKDLPPLFANSALVLIHSETKGIPRLINTIVLMPSMKLSETGVRLWRMLKSGEF